MPEGRPPIPAALKREVLVEAGHRCAIPTCKNPTTEVAHIVPYRDEKSHSFDNLIALCPNCHTRYDVVKDIDRKSVLQYKANLSVLNGRYGDLERRLMHLFAESGAKAGTVVDLPGGLEFLLYYLMMDGLLERVEGRGAVMAGSGGVLTQVSPQRYRLTDAGEGFIQHWLGAEPLP